MELHDLLSKYVRINKQEAQALDKLGIKTVYDILFYFPARYGAVSEFKMVQRLVPNEHATVFGRIRSLKSGKAFVKKTPFSEAVIEDETGSLKALWFHQPYLAKMLKEDALVRVEGVVSERNSVRSMINPHIETISKIPLATGNSLFSGETHEYTNLYPTYPESKGVTSNWIYHTVQKIFKQGVLEKVADPIPEDILKKYNLPSRKTALVWIHSPKSEKDATSARKRFAFEEVFFIQLKKQQSRLEAQDKKSYLVEVDKHDITDFTSRFPFTPTEAQNKALGHIFEDFTKTYPMSRLLEGDVGSGKTAVAATAAYAVIKNRPNKQNFGNLQIAYMAPTEILATQHFESFIEYFKHLPIQVGLLTSSGCRKFPAKIKGKHDWTSVSRAQLLKWVANGEIPILIGTHSLIQKSVIFKHLALVIIDEQHRFGTKQRSELAKKESFAPHLLSMTATPIPRTLALTIYGDLDLTLLDQMPAGRKEVITKIITPEKRSGVYEDIRAEMKKGRQLYVICPRIDDADPAKELALNVRSVVSEAKNLKEKIFKDSSIAILHSKMTKIEKESVMEKFSKGEIDILVATSVVEVGVNVPNATMIIIEGGERFGLSQLHQLRGRVIRSSHQAYCYIFAESKSQKTTDRLKAIITAKNGFELSEMDLKLRGSGELVGKKQWGLSDIGMEAIKNLKMVEAARLEATRIISEDKDIVRYPLLKQEISHAKFDIHFE